MDASPTTAMRIARLEDQVAALSAMVRPAAATILLPGRRGAPTIAAVIGAVADAWGMEPADILSARREQPTALARQVAVHLARRLTGHSFPAIGRAFGRDHSTIQYANLAIAARCNADPALAQRVDALAALLTLSTPESKEAPRP